LGGDHSLLRRFEPYGIIFMNACAVITVTNVKLLRDFGPVGATFISTLGCPIILDGQFTSKYIITRLLN
jgi:hypothetical protein